MDPPSRGSAPLISCSRLARERALFGLSCEYMEASKSGAFFNGFNRGQTGAHSRLARVATVGRRSHQAQSGKAVFDRQQDSGPNTRSSCMSCTYFLLLIQCGPRLPSFSEREESPKRMT